MYALGPFFKINLIVSNIKFTFVITCFSNISQIVYNKLFNYYIYDNHYCAINYHCHYNHNQFCNNYH